MLLALVLRSLGRTRAGYRKFWREEGLQLLQEGFETSALWAEVLLLTGKKSSYCIVHYTSQLV